MKDLEKEIELIKERNKRVETDKAWETSWTRKICIAVLTYLVVVAYNYGIVKIEYIFIIFSTSYGIFTFYFIS